MTTVKLTGYDPHSVEMSGETFTIEVEGTTFHVEFWSTHNASGLDVYAEDWTPVPDDVLPEDSWDLFEEWRDVAVAKWQEHVQPAIDRATAELLAEAEVKEVG